MTKTGPVSMAGAIETFAKGYSFMRETIHPSGAERFRKVWVVRDPASTPPKRRRGEEFIGHGITPMAMAKIASKNARGRYSICAIHAPHESDQPLRTGYKKLRHRLITTESFMAHPLKAIPTMAPPRGIAIRRITDLTLANAVAKKSRMRLISPEHLKESNPPVRAYTALHGTTPVGWVRSIMAGGNSWCGSMVVVPAWRRKGIAKALMCLMLKDDKEAGAKSAVLLASHTGAMLYPVLGYVNIGTLLLFIPPRR